jgi:hypothetical protein
VKSEVTPEPARSPVRPPESATPTTRVRAQGIFDGSRFVAGSVKRIGPGDPDIELDGPIESIDVTSGSLRVLGTNVPIAEAAKDGIRDVSDLQAGQHVRIHGSIERGGFLATKVERVNSRSIEIEGVIRSITVVDNGDATIDVGGLSFLVDPRASWIDFPDSATVQHEEIGRGTLPAVRVTEELFDRVSDPAEVHDVSASRPADLQRMRELARQAHEALMQQSRVGRAAIDSGTRERLRALGYVE